MSKDVLKRSANISEVGEWTRFHCLIAAMLSNSALELGSQSPDVVFRVFDDMVRLIPQQQ